MADHPERFVPGEMSGQLVEAEHRARYAWLAAYAAGRRVLDAGCGFGYGAAMLAAAGATEVVGVDRSETTLDLARPSMPIGVELRKADVASLPFADGEFDVVACFGVLEHVADWREAVNQLRRVLAPGGLIAVSVGTGPRLHEAGHAGTAHESRHAHAHVFRTDEVVAELRAHWKNVSVRPQAEWAASAIFPPEMSERRGAVSTDGLGLIKLDVVAVEAAHGAVFLASDDELVEPPPVLVLGGRATLLAWHELFERQTTVLREQEAHLSNLDAIASERKETQDLLLGAETRLARLGATEHELSDERRLRERLETRAAELAKRATDWERHARFLERELEAFRRTVSWRLTAPLRRVRRLLGRGRF